MVSECKTGSSSIYRFVCHFLALREKKSLPEQEVVACPDLRPGFVPQQQNAGRIDRRGASPLFQLGEQCIGGCVSTGVSDVGSDLAPSRAAQTGSVYDSRHFRPTWEIKLSLLWFIDFEVAARPPGK